MIRVKDPQDFWAGVLFLAVGSGGVWFGREYDIGVIMRMGPGYLPRVLSLALIGIGLLLALRALALAGPAIQRSLVRPQVFILAAIVVFALMIERFGLAPAVFVAAIVAAAASREMRWIEAAALAFALATGTIVLFIYLLGQSMEKWIF